ncbi:MAG TPA: hypothetical protein VGM67_16050 [Gemmatimonadaceae bacterium]|jgi:hypothetical protein
MASASKLRTVSRFLGSLALIVAVARLCLAVMNHTALPLVAVVAAVIVCALVWVIPIGGGGGALA